MISTHKLHIVSSTTSGHMSIRPVLNFNFNICPAILITISIYYYCLLWPSWFLRMKLEKN